MCTLMQKDVLIEMVANTMAIINVRTDPNVINNEDQSYLVGIRNYLYKTHHNQIDFDGLLNNINMVKDKYVDLPVNQYYV